jgi:hypothetical protein
MEDNTFRVDVSMYLREVLGIRYVNLDQLTFDGRVYTFGSHRFTAHASQDGSWTFMAHPTHT